MKIVPLKHTFMVTAIAGFLISAFFITPRSLTWGLTLVIFFATMFIASFISMTYAPLATHPPGK